MISRPKISSSSKVTLSTPFPLSIHLYNAATYFQHGDHFRRDNHILSLPPPHHPRILFHHQPGDHCSAVAGLHFGWIDGFGRFFEFSISAMPWGIFIHIIYTNTSIQQPYERSFDRQSAPIAFLGIIFLFLGITDLVAISMPEEVSQYHWGVQGLSSAFFIQAETQN